MDGLAARKRGYAYFDDGPYLGRGFNDKDVKFDLNQVYQTMSDEDLMSDDGSTKDYLSEARHGDNDMPLKRDQQSTAKKRTLLKKTNSNINEKEVRKHKFTLMTEESDSDEDQGM